MQNNNRWQVFLGRSLKVFWLVTLILGLLFTTPPNPVGAEVNAWNTVSPMSAARAMHSAHLLPDGRLLVVGGGSSYVNLYLASADIYDLQTDSWAATGSLHIGRSNPAVTQL